MERKSIPSLSLTLAIIAVLTISAFTAVAFAPPAPIGDKNSYAQKESFDSNPKAGTFANVGTPTGLIGNAFDGDLGTNINFIYGATATAGYVEVSAFKIPSEDQLPDFPISFIDIKVDYRATSTATTLDKYRIVAIEGANTIVLQDYVWGTDPLNHLGTYPPGINTNPAVRTFSNVAEPIDGVWSWGDIAALKVRVETLQGTVTPHINRVYLHEVFVTAYSSAFPPELQMTVMPPVVMETSLAPGGTGYVYYDIYISGVTNLWGYQFVLKFDPAVLYPMEYMSYGPFISALPSEIGADYVAVAFKTYDGDPVGFTGATPMARIWFLEINPGAGCHLPFDTSVTPPTLADIFGRQIQITWQGGEYNPGIPEFPIGVGIMMLFLPALPLAYIWRMRKKERG